MKNLSIISLIVLLLFSTTIVSCSKEMKAQRTIEKYLVDLNGEDDTYEFLYLDLIKLCKNFDNNYLIQADIESYLTSVVNHTLLSNLYELSEGSLKTSNTMQDSVEYNRFGLKLINDIFIDQYGSDECVLFIYRGKDYTGDVKQQAEIFILDEKFKRVIKYCSNNYHKFALCESAYHLCCTKNCVEFERFSNIKTYVK